MPIPPWISDNLILVTFQEMFLYITCDSFSLNVSSTDSIQLLLMIKAELLEANAILTISRNTRLT